ncbi:MAG: ABC transporter permease [Nitrospirae bacterium]|nr:ABC transporter permease [Nitrospirota bacterium]
MAWRESRASWRRFLFFFLCIAIGVGAMVAVGLFSQNVEAVIFGDARALLGGDIELRSSRPLTEHSHTVLESIYTRDIKVVHVSELVAMAASDQSESPSSQSSSTQLVQLKVVENLYPFYGVVEIQPPGPLMEFLKTSPSGCHQDPCFGAIVQESLLFSLGLEVGKILKIGQAYFVVTGVMLKEPDRVAMGVGLGPRVMISREALASTELVKPGSRIRERYLLQLPPTYPLEALVGELKGRLSKDGVRVSTYREAQPRIKRFLDQLATYLGLIGLTALFVGGIGVAATIQGFIAQKMNTVAILKTVGAEAGFILRTYLFQSMFMGVIGSLVGIVLGIGFLVMLPTLLKDIFPLPITTTIFVFPLMKGMALGTLSTGLFTVWPLLSVRQVSPLRIFRRDIDQPQNFSGSASMWKNLKGQVQGLLQDRYRLATGVGVGMGLSGLAMWQARSPGLGLTFIVAFGVALLLLLGAMKLLVWGLSTMTRPRSFVMRQAMGNIQRPGSQASGMVVAIGVGVMVIVSIALIKTSLLTAIGERMPKDAPTFFFVDIQPDQKTQFEAVVQANTKQAEVLLTPVVRSRLSAINGTPINPEDHKGKRNGWYFTREYVVTSLSELPKENEVVKGQWWQQEKDATKESQEIGHQPIRVSLEDEASKNLKAGLGSTIEFDIQGTPLIAEVDNLRKVEWGGMAINFFMILSPGALDGAPFTYIGSAKVRPEEEVALQKAIVAAVPNVTAIKVGDILKNIATLLNQLAWAIQGMASLCIVSGIVVMTAAVSTTRFRRLYESAVLKAIGGTRSIILQTLAAEFALVGGLAGVIGVTLASVLSWAVLVFFLDLPWTFQPETLGLGIVVTVVMALAVGFLSTYRILGEPPLAVLRQE